MGSWLLLSRDVVRNPELIVGDALVGPVLDARMVLRPAMMASYTGIGTPATLGYYQFNIQEDTRLGWPHFVALNTINNAWVTGNGLKCKTKNVAPTVFTPGSVSPVAPFAIGTMVGKLVTYRVGLGGDIEMYMWNPSVHVPGTTVATMTFIDSGMNVAWVSPVMVGQSTSTTVEYYAPGIEIDVVSADSFTCTIRVTRSHVTNGIRIDTTAPGSLVMSWLADALALGVADPADPLNDDVVLVTVPRGKYTFGARCNYVDAVNGAYDCYSELGCVVEVF